MDIPFPLISDIAQGRCLPFIGAGFSKNASLPTGYSMPDWTELALLLANDAGTPSGMSPELIAQRYERKFGRVQLVEAIRGALHLDKAQPGQAHRLFARLPFDTIYTTNFDFLLEEAYSQEARPFRSLVGELQLPFHAGQLASNIVKMHGDLRHEEHIIITARDFDEFTERYPVVATHLSAMLITRTPLFIGYSLSDPDFESIRKVIKSRLGAFERMAYVIQFDIETDAKEQALDKKLHIISLSTEGGMNRDELLTNLFSTIQEQLDTKAGVELRSSRPDLFEEVKPEVVKKAVESLDQTPVIEATSRLCFVMMPFGKRFDEVYRNLIAPSVSQNGLTALRADEMVGSGFIMEQIRSAIQQSRLCIADLTGNNANVLYEVGYAQAVGKPLILLAQETSQLPFDIAHQRVIAYETEVEKSQLALRKAIGIVLSENRLSEAARLLDLGLYRSSVAASAVILEQILRSMLSRQAPQSLSRMSMGQMVIALKRRKTISANQISKLVQVVDIRNRAVHGIDEPSQKEAELVLSFVRDFSEKYGKGEDK